MSETRGVLDIPQSPIPPRNDQSLNNIDIQHDNELMDRQLDLIRNLSGRDSRV